MNYFCNLQKIIDVTIYIYIVSCFISLYYDTLAIYLPGDKNKFIVFRAFLF